MRRLHRERRTGITAREHPEILGDVFAWNKLFRTSFWREQGLEWPEGVRYEDQPTTTRAYLAGTFDVVPDVVYHWRIRQDGIVDHPAARVARPTCATAGGPSGWRSTPCRSTTTPARRRTSSTACWPATCTATSSRSPDASDEWWRLLVDGDPRPVGRAVAGAQRPPARAPPRRLAGRARPPRRRRVGGAVAAGPWTDRRRGTATTWSSRPTCWTCPTSTPPPSPSATTSDRRWLRTDAVRSACHETSATDVEPRWARASASAPSVDPASARLDYRLPGDGLGRRRGPVLRRQLVDLRAVLDGLPARAHRGHRGAPVAHRGVGPRGAGARGPARAARAPQLHDRVAGHRRHHDPLHDPVAGALLAAAAVHRALADHRDHRPRPLLADDLGAQRAGRAAGGPRRRWWSRRAGSATPTCGCSPGSSSPSRCR